MFVDASALLAFLLQEPEAEKLSDAFGDGIEPVHLSPGDLRDHCRPDEQEEPAEACCIMRRREGGDEFVRYATPSYLNGRWRFSHCEKAGTPN